MKRRLTPAETRLLSYIIKDTPEGPEIIETLPTIFVEEMDDGGMGSLKVVIEGKDERRTGGILNDMEFHDIDGMLLVITVILDTDDKFYELDIFKGDFSPLIKMPDVPD
ncbi:DUF6984 family protein [Sphingobacterium sp. 2149]|uniref:DUF6984 family protein n=1 Tax=Sphingobacterium sp. 2149 TaxID=2817763 RepID=UPI001AE2E59C|nr:hypothetical protein [Sphingobacterium sp. 2149]MDR6736344.1 hypothetical protein [Sphingobacterium sp. 2149]